MDELHPFAVHFPVALVILYPFFELVAALTKRRDLGWVAIGVLGVAIAGSLFASATGEEAYDVAIAAGFSHDLLESHEELAEKLPWFLIAAFGVRLYLQFKQTYGAWVGFALGVVLQIIVLQVGYTGGKLVYEEGVGVRAELMRSPKEAAGTDTSTVVR